MEAALFILNALALLALAVWSLVNERRKPGAPMVGWFRYKEEEAPAPEPGPERAPAAAGWRGRAKRRA